jgi:hypothetical protein
MYGAYLSGLSLEVNYETTRAVSLTDPCARALARAVGFRSVKQLMLWNDAQGRTMSDLLDRLDVAIQNTAPAPADPLVDVAGYALGASELPTLLGAWARARRRTVARLRLHRARRLGRKAVRSEDQTLTQSQLTAQVPGRNVELVLDALGAGSVS